MSKEIALLLDNRLNVSSDLTQVVDICGQQAQYYRYSADPGNYQSNMQFSNIVPVGSLSNTLMSRKMTLHYQLTLTVVAAANAANALHVAHIFPTSAPYLDSAVYVADNLAFINSSLRAFPLQSICDTVQVSINNSTTTWNARPTMPALLRLLPTDLLKNAEMCPVRPDDGFTLIANSNAGELTYAVMHPQSTAQNAGDGAFSRNALRPVVSSLVAGTITYTWDIYEPLIVPGINSLQNEVMLGNVNNLSLIFSYSQLSDLYSGLNSILYTDTVSVAIGSPELLLSYQTVDTSVVTIPKAIVYSYEGINYFPQAGTQCPALDAGAIVPLPLMQSNTVRLQSLPKYIGFFMRFPISTRNGNGTAANSPALADGCFALNNQAGCVSISLGARNGLLANATRADLWRMSRECGSTQSYASFCNNGSWVWVNPTVHFGVNVEGGDILPGENGSINFQVQAQYTTGGCYGTVQSAAGLGNLPNAATNTEFVIVAIYSGVMTISPDMVQYSLSIITPNEVDGLLKAGDSTSREVLENSIKGAGLYSPKTVLFKGARGRGNMGGVLSMA